MLFRQRKQTGLGERIRLCLWPRRSFSRSLRYFGKRLLRIRARPHSIALGLAIGVFFACSPFYGLHIIFAVFFAWIFSANIAAAALGTILANPITIPLLFGMTYETGRLLLPVAHKTAAVNIIWGELCAWNFSSISAAVLQIGVGAVLWGGILAAAAYITAYKAAKRFHSERQKTHSRPLLKYVP